MLNKNWIFTNYLFFRTSVVDHSPRALLAICRWQRASTTRRSGPRAVQSRAPWTGPRPCPRPGLSLGPVGFLGSPDRRCRPLPRCRAPSGLRSFRALSASTAYHPQDCGPLALCANLTAATWKPSWISSKIFKSIVSLQWTVLSTDDNWKYCYFLPTAQSWVVILHLHSITYISLAWILSKIKKNYYYRIGIILIQLI